MKKRAKKPAATAAAPPPEPPPQAPRRPLETVVAAGCGLVAFATYLFTLSPTVAGGDSGELIAAAYGLGMVHPPGYPLYTLLGWLFTLLPVSTVAWRVNLLSAACDACAAALLARAAILWTGRVSCGFFAAAAFAFSEIVWPYAVIAEVFALNNLFAAGLVLLSVRATLDRAGNLWRLPLAAFWAGLGLSNHHTLAFLAAPCLVYLLWLERARALTPRGLATCAVAFAIGLLPYAYLPVAAARTPEVLWGDPTTLSGFFTHLLRREYGTFRLATSETGEAGQLVERLLLFARRFGASSFGLGPVLVAASALALGRGSSRRWLTASWLAALVFYLVTFSVLSNVRLDDALHLTVQERFWQQALVVGAVLMAAGLASLLERLPARASAWAGGGAAFLLCAALLIANGRSLDHRERVFLRDYGAAILAELPRDALLLITSDEAIGSVRHAQLVLGQRTDVRVIPTGQLTSPWFWRFAERRLPGVSLPEAPFSARRFIDLNIGRFPIFLVNKVPWLETLEQGYHPWPVGLSDRVLPRGTTPDLETWATGVEQSLRRFDPAAGDVFPTGSWERYAAANAWRQYRRFATAFAGAVATRSDDRAVLRLLLRVLEPLALRLPSPEPSLFKNLGVTYQFLARSEPGARDGMIRHWRRYLELAPPDDKDVAAIRMLIAQRESSKP